LKKFSSLSAQSCEAITKLVRARYEDDLKYRTSKTIMSGMNFIQWCDSIDMMMRKEHEPAELEVIPEMQRYFALGVTRVDATIAWRQDLLLNTSEAPFTLKPTPVPTMAPAVVSSVTEKIMQELWARVGSNLPPEQLVAMGVPIDPVKKFIKQQAPEMKKTMAEYLNREAASGAAEAETLVKDLAVEGGWRKAFWELQALQTLYPVAIMCGPEIVPAKVRAYNATGKRIYKNGYAQQWRTVNARNFYFGSDSTGANDGRGCTEVRYKNRARLIQAMENSAYNAKALHAVLDEFQTSSRDWLAGNYDDKVTTSWSNTPGEEIAVLIHSGQISGDELLEAGVTGVEHYKMYEVRVEVVGSNTIYCQLSEFFDSGDGTNLKQARPYFSSSWKVNHGSPYGRSLGMLLRDPQLVLNRLHYYMMSNAYNSHLPMTEVSSSRLSSPADWFYQPGSAFETRSESKIEGEHSALKLHQTPATFGALFNLFVGRMKMVDDEIGITAVSYGSMLMTPDDQTLGGQLQRISGSARGLKDAIYNQDIQIIEPSIQRCVSILQDEGLVTGDVNVEARGAASLIQKDVVQQQQQKTLPLLANAASTDPSFKPAYKELLSQIFGNMGVPRDLLPNSTMEKEFAAASLQGLPATPQMKADGRSLNADQIGGTL
jgi:hypothetical protein